MSVMEELNNSEFLEYLKLVLFLFFIVMTAVGINNTIEVLKLKNEFTKIDFENQFHVQRFANLLIQSKIPSLSIKIMLLKALKEDCEQQNYDHIISKIDSALDELTKKG